MTLLSREAILKAEDFTFEDIDVPEWGGTVRVKALSGAERDHFESTVIQQKGRKSRMNMTNLRARLVALTVIDDTGKRIFEPRDVESLGQKSAAALDDVFSVAMRLAGMRDEDMEELTENFPDDPSDGFISD